MHSYNVVEEPGFVAVMNAAMPEYVMPSRTTFSRAIILELYASKKQNLMHSLQAVIDGGVEAISITTDSWTSRANESYLSVTCHIMDSSFQLHVHALACTEMADAHTAKNFVLFLKSVMKEWALPDPDGSKRTGPSIKDDVRNYLRAPLLPRCEDPLDWWKSKGSHLHPSLVRVARRYLSVPATQTTSERLFSTAGAIVTCRREHLLTQHVEQLVFPHDNF
ncbi:hypothetical protein MRX96_038990 [Rhipicephalus microplus]